ncbi:MAG: preprotein translocase subunit SecE [bacterium]|nr:preprotein translocase subunit SecE [bacterium]
MFAKIKNYFVGARQEFKTIQWPSFKQTRTLTIVVIAISLGVAIYLGVADFILTAGLTKLIEFK